MNGYVAVIAAIAGALIYALSTPAPARQTVFGELGRLTFFAAMIGLMVAFAVHTAHLF